MNHTPIELLCDFDLLVHADSLNKHGLQPALWLNGTTTATIDLAIEAIQGHLCQELCPVPGVAAGPIRSRQMPWHLNPPPPSTFAAAVTTAVRSVSASPSPTGHKLDDSYGSVDIGNDDNVPPPVFDEDSSSPSDATESDDDDDDSSEKSDSDDKPLEKPTPVARTKPTTPVPLLHAAPRTPVEDEDSQSRSRSRDKRGSKKKDRSGDKKRLRSASPPYRSSRRSRSASPSQKRSRSSKKKDKKGDRREVTAATKKDRAKTTAAAKSNPKLCICYDHRS
jgi:hypothetical protein